MFAILKMAFQKFGVYATQIPNKDPNSRGFDFYAYANDDPRYKVVYLLALCFLFVAAF